jgi:dynein heavy chain 2
MDIEVRALYFVGRALFKSDRPMFALHLVKGMHPDHFQPREWEIFTGSLVASVTDVAPKGFPSWAPSERQSAFRLLSEQLPHLVASLELENVSKWQRFATSSEAEKDIPGTNITFPYLPAYFMPHVYICMYVFISLSPVCSALLCVMMIVLRGVSPFQRVLVVQAFRPDRLQSALLSFCCDLLRIDSVSPPPLSLPHLYEESTELSPILLISSPGADASKELQEYAAKSIGSGNYDELAMGGGQQDVAVQMLRSAASNGTWLCLKNLHLVIAWLPALEKELSSLQPHRDFRLWLTSEAHPAFPSILLQMSLKATYESPPGS